jgi:hypothetical protein
MTQIRSVPVISETGTLSQAQLALRKYLAPITATERLILSEIFSGRRLEIGMDARFHPIEQ